LTVHPRPDARHARAEDVHMLSRLCRERGVEFNLEGNPFADPRPGYPGFLALCEQSRPHQVTLVPDADGQLTSDHGFDFARQAQRLKPLVAALRALGCRVSLFADAGSEVAAAANLGADRIELYTGPYGQLHADGDAGAALEACSRTAREACAAGLGVNAGHDLNQQNLADFLAAIPEVLEVSIGHALISEALYDGLAPTVRRYRAIVDASAA
ncbi:MAG: pyridoxine 5'-phosphate synthase, partial [Lysobacter sp.]|nr:pyridoxine 5'-phosphate synthase [Lysobacter sp.]